MQVIKLRVVELGVDVVFVVRPPVTVVHGLWVTRKAILKAFAGNES